MSASPMYRPLAGGGASFEGEAGMSSEVDGIIEQLMVAMSIGQTVGQYHNHHMACDQSLMLQQSTAKFQHRMQTQRSTQGLRPPTRS